MAAGFEAVTRSALQEDLTGVRIGAEGSGLLTVTAPLRVANEIGVLPYFSLVLLELGSTRVHRLDDAIEVLAEQLMVQERPAMIDAERGFRIRVSDRGSLVSVLPRARSALEGAVAEWSALRPHLEEAGLSSG